MDITTCRNLLVGPIALAALYVSSAGALNIARRAKAIAIVSFNANSQPEIAIGRGVVANVEADLIDSNLFKVVINDVHVEKAVPDFDYWRTRRVDALIVGRVSKLVLDRVKIEFRLWDVVAGKQITGGMHFVEVRILASYRPPYFRDHHQRPAINVECPLLAQSGHSGGVDQCPLSGVKQTWRLAGVTSAFDPAGIAIWWRGGRKKRNCLTCA